MSARRDDTIDLDWKSGSVSGANWRERAGLALLRLAAVATQSPERPGFSKLANGVAKLFPSDKFVRVHFPDQTVYQFPYGDAYWSVLCAPGFTYEREIEGFVRRCAREKLSYVFVDCGANFGYWSCRISSDEAGGQRAIAIEASSESFGHTMRNRLLNDNRFDAHHRAISNEHGKVVTLYGGEKHEQRSIVQEETTGDLREQVMSLALDRLQDIDPVHDKLVVKLDVEGVEIPALEGASSWLDHDTLVVFEDHGRDTNHTTARAMKDRFGLRVFAGSSEGHFTEITEFDQMTRLKTVKRKGYDFFATRSPFWLKFMAGE
ncbi:MAG: FkbM family methyltransferase [Pseudomonadota bacterium]